MVELKGVIPALTTPFKEDRSLDLAALRRLNDIVLEDGVDGVLVAGCSGETWALDDNERLAIFEATVDQTAGRAPVIGGCGDIFANRVID
ncbi:MAG: dihydrodipicolinate synthase family protein, partial [Rhodospirillales bacterium]|nr:dihydrodipicolinate synthase family protein [Rhodospirillales bacterium]